MVTFRVAVNRPCLIVLFNSRKTASAEKPAVFINSYAKEMHRRSTSTGIVAGFELGTLEGDSVGGNVA